MDKHFLHMRYIGSSISHVFNSFHVVKNPHGLEKCVLHHQIMKTLLKYTDALPDGMVFDQKLQDQVMRRIIGQEEDEKKAVVEHYALYELNRFLLKIVKNGCH